MLKSINQFKIKLQQKNIIVLSGNVYDTFYYNKNGQQVIETLDKIIADTAIDLKYSSVEKFSPSRGVINLVGNSVSSTAVITDDSSDFINDGNTDGASCSPLLKFVDEIKTKVIDENHQASIFVIDFSDLYFNQNSQNIIEPLAAMLSAMLDQEVIGARNISKLNLQNKIILVTRDDGNLINDLTSKNIELSNVKINKPNINERRYIFENSSSIFSITNGNELSVTDSPAQSEAIGLTDSFSCKEILQLGRIETESKDLTFKELYSVAQFNKRESEWEKINAKTIKALKEILSRRVKGQDGAIKRVEETIISSRLGLNGILHSDKLTRPKGILFFVGPTGTGKTELSKAIAEVVFGDEAQLIRFDMSEYSLEHSDQRLIGAPPGYVGYDAGGELTNAVLEKPFSILLFDEIEKANGKILDKFLQILEDGRLTSSKGDLVDFSETFIIFTSNIGAADVKPSDNEKEVHANFVREVKDHFVKVLKRPELLNRIGYKNIVPFNFITDHKIISEIIISKINKAKVALEKNYNISVELSDNVIKDLTEIVATTKEIQMMGGRGITTQVETLFVDKISQFIFERLEEIEINKANEKITHIKTKVVKDELEFEYI